MAIEEYLNRKKEDIGRLLVKCPDRPGIVSALSTFLYEHGGDIMESTQFSSDDPTRMFFIRIEFYVKDLLEKRGQMERDFKPLAEEFQIDYKFSYNDRRKRAAIFVSREIHCLLELLWEWQSGDLDMDIPLVISNHEVARDIVEQHGIPYYYIPANKDIREEVEVKQLKLLEQYDVDFIILARYMQILTPNFVARYPNRIINIHHSFLPAFIGARPYERAYERGVKLIGATSHYVTDELDQGPIIEQDIERVDHRNNVASLKKIGQRIERTVLARAVKWHIQDRIIVKDNKTIVFQ